MYATAGHVPSSSEPISSISDMSQEEDVAYCLMMLSRDKWTKKRIEVIEDDDEEEEERKNFRVVKMKKTRTRGKYICKTCNRVFRSYQALGGHIASHKKIKVVTSETSKMVETAKNEVKIHECSVCYRVFSSGQALGGHKRSHAIASRNSVLLK
uniref:C2H2 zinc-finger protein ZPT3-3 n=1 Tax=Solanum tuberosum TaxID=4113 RepID=M1BVN4_SOLTU